MPSDPKTVLAVLKLLWNFCKKEYKIRFNCFIALRRNGSDTDKDSRVQHYPLHKLFQPVTSCIIKGSDKNFKQEMKLTKKVWVENN